MSTRDGSAALLVVLSAPSGAGKTTMARRLLTTFGAQARLSVSYTTRAPRGQEVDGQDYHFVDTRTFEQMIDRGDFIEWAQVYGHFYGSPWSVVEAASQERGMVVFDIDVQGGASLKRRFPQAVLVFILPPSMEELERRLRARRTDTDDAIRRRLLSARAEVERGLGSYDYVIVNDDLERGFDELRSVVIAEKARLVRLDPRVRAHFVHSDQRET